MSKYVQLVFIINKTGLTGEDTLAVIRNEIAKNKKANCKNKIELFKAVKRWTYVESKTYGGYGSAFDAIFENDMADYGELVILPYFDNDKYFQLPKYKKLKNKIANAEETKKLAKQKIKENLLKIESKKCPECKSIINKQHFYNSSYCPVCKTELAFKTDKNRLTKAETNLKAALTELEQFEQQLFESDKLTIWLAAGWVKVADDFKPKGIYMFDIYQYINK